MFIPFKFLAKTKTPRKNSKVTLRGNITDVSLNENQEIVITQGDINESVIVIDKDKESTSSAEVAAKGVEQSSRRESIPLKQRLRMRPVMTTATEDSIKEIHKKTMEEMIDEFNEGDEMDFELLTEWLRKGKKNSSLSNEACYINIIFKNLSLICYCFFFF